MPVSASLHAGCRFLMLSIASVGIVLLFAALIGVFRKRAWRNMLKVSEMEFFLIIALFAFFQPFIRPLAQHVCQQ